MPEDRTFLDTNVIVYGFDRSAGRKHQIAEQILVDLWNSGTGIVSTQVLQEFFVTVTRKIAKPMDPAAAKDIVGDLLKWDVVVNDGDSILGAIDIQLRYKYSFWDSMIIHAAVSGGAERILSEDLSAGQAVQGAVIVNPFEARR